MLRNLCRLNVSLFAKFASQNRFNMIRREYISSIQDPIDNFMHRHIGITTKEQTYMLKILGEENIDNFINKVIPNNIRITKLSKYHDPLGEVEALNILKSMANKNKNFKSFIGAGYYGTITPPVLKRNILENPTWLTPYTPYQSEISQGRLETGIVYQTVICDLTGLAVSNSSLLDEATAASEAIIMCYHHCNNYLDKRKNVIVSKQCHPQTIAVIKTRLSRFHNIKIILDDNIENIDPETIACVVLQYPGTDGRVENNLKERIKDFKSKGIYVIIGSDLLSLTLLQPPGNFGADICYGTSQRFGIPLNFGGPHAAFISCKNEMKRSIPGRIVGKSRDAHGQIAYRLCLQTREQHIRRERATSNICTSQALLAHTSALYAVYHGKRGLKKIALKIHRMAIVLSKSFEKLGYMVNNHGYEIFDTVLISLDNACMAENIMNLAYKMEYNLRRIDPKCISISLDEATSVKDIDNLIGIFSEAIGVLQTIYAIDIDQSLKYDDINYSKDTIRIGSFLEHAIFRDYQSETKLLRYIYYLSRKDYGLQEGMIPLGSCTMKLNASVEMEPITWPEFSHIHPFSPHDQTEGYRELFSQLEKLLCEITGFSACTLQPNAGSQGELTGLLMIRAYHDSLDQPHRKICLIPTSAHGTNAASAALAGMIIKNINCDSYGNVDIKHLESTLEECGIEVSCMMITYPSTHGVFEKHICDIVNLVHKYGGQIYLDGANMNAQCGLTNPAIIGADCCHLNLHKTYCFCEGSMIRLANGLERKIEELNIGDDISAYDEIHDGISSGKLTALYSTGSKECVKITLEDGRTINCTPDHLILTKDGWIEAGNLMENDYRIIIGPEGTHDYITDNEKDWYKKYDEIELSMKTNTKREQTLAFFRIMGYLLTDGTCCLEKSNSRVHMRISFGSIYDAKMATNDIYKLTNFYPKISKNESESKGITYNIKIPFKLKRAILTVDGFPSPGKKIHRNIFIPDCVLDIKTPKAIRREFFGGLFGGDGCSPVITHLHNNPDNMRGVRFSQTRTNQKDAEDMINSIISGLDLLDIKSYLNFSKQQKSVNDEPRWKSELIVDISTKFAERIGFRYCTHKTARLTVATAWWRMRETIIAQRNEVAQIAMIICDNIRKGKNDRTWDQITAQAFLNLSLEEKILNPYYTSFMGNSRITRQNLNNSIYGHPREVTKNMRRSGSRIVIPPTNKKGESTGIPTLNQFLTSCGTINWFSEHTDGSDYKVTYATSQESLVEPVISLKVIDVRPAGKKEVYDITVENLHNFMANGVVAHNCVPHGGGGPGMGPVCVAKHLIPFLPTHPMVKISDISVNDENSIGTISAAPWSSASILPISWMYINLMGSEGLRRATEIAILNSNYMMQKLKNVFPIRYTNPNKTVGHEFILDMNNLRKYNIKSTDIAKRLQDYGFHPATIDFPVPNTMMIEPTESENLFEIDRFINALTMIASEIEDIKNGVYDTKNNVIKHAPHTIEECTSSNWDNPYSREMASFPVKSLRERKFWPRIKRIDDVYGDQNFQCTLK